MGALTTDPATNIAMRSAVGSKTSYMKAILAKGGAPEIIEEFYNHGEFMKNSSTKSGSI